jgi:hypothetical protein
MKQNPPSERFQNVKGIEKNLNAELNAVLLDAFDYCFVGILERCIMFVASGHNF